VKKDEVFSKPGERSSDFTFNAEVAAVFDDMLVRSVPHYLEQQALIQEIARKFFLPGTRAYDLGCSTGTTLIRLADTLGPDASLVGVDNSEPMLAKARENLRDAGVQNQVDLICADLNEDLTNASFENASVATLCWTLQFIRPLRRDAVVRWIFDGMVEGGALICCEKVLTNSSDMNRYFIDFYYDFKRRNGYSEEEILKKREALENVLVPYRTDENFELFRRSGFRIVETFFQWYNFAGFLCVKQ